MRRAVRWAIFAGVLTAMAPETVRAQEATTEREAQARFEEGLARVRAGNFEGARVSFLQAYAVLQKPSILWNLALAEEKTGNVLSALGHFKHFVRVAPAGDDRSVAEKHIGELMGQTGHVDVAAPTGAEVVLDGTPVGVAPLGDAIDVLPGKHRLEAQTPQGAREGALDVLPGQFVRVSLIAAADATSPPPDSIHLAPAASDANAPARQPAPAREQEARASESEASSKGRLVVVTLAGATSAVLVGLGVYFALQSQSESSTADQYRRQYGPNFCFQSSADPCPAWNETVQTQSRDASLSNVLYATGGVLAAAAVMTWFLWPKSVKSAAKGKTLTLSATGNSLHVAGQF
jgi:hypothetical protein